MQTAKGRKRGIIDYAIAVVLALILSMLACAWLAPAPNDAYAEPNLTTASVEASLGFNEPYTADIKRGGSYYDYNFTLDKPTTVKVDITWDEWTTRTSPSLQVAAFDIKHSSYQGTKVYTTSPNFTHTETLDAGEHTLWLYGSGSSKATITLSDVSVYASVISAEDITVHAKQSAQIAVKAAPSTATVYAYSYESADKSIATVDGDGMVSGISEGETSVTITETYSGASTNISITVTSGVVDSKSGAKTVFTELDETNYGKVSYRNAITYTFDLPFNGIIQFDVSWEDGENSRQEIRTAGFDETTTSYGANLLGTFDQHSYSTTKFLTKGTHTISISGYADVSFTMKLTDASSHPTDIHIDDMTVYVYNEEVIFPSFTPRDALNSNITYTSADASIANAELGIVKGLGVGSTTITAEHSVTGAKTTFNVTVVDPPIDRIGNENVKLAVGHAWWCGVESPATEVPISYKTSNANIVSVNSEGIATAKNLGIATITATTTSGKTVQWTIHVNSLTINRIQGSKMKFSEYGKYIQNYKKAKWTSNKKSTAKISSKKVIFKNNGKKGTATITIKSKGKSYKIKVYTDSKNYMKKTAKKWFKSNLKFPKSMVTNSKRYYVSISDYNVLRMDISAMNSFGGYTRNTYYFIFNGHKCHVTY